MPPSQYIIDEPIPLLLTNDGLADHSGLLQQLVGGLKHTLEMRRIPLVERKLLAKPVERHPPGEHVSGPGQLDEAVKPPGHGRREREISADGQHDDVPRREVLPHDG